MPELHGISRWALLVGTLLLTGSTTAWAQSGSVAAPPRLPRPQSMRVVDAESPTESAGLYTIVGAVTRSGVYHSSEKSLPVWRLIEAANGVTSEAGPAFRVIRHQVVRFQILYDPAAPKPSDTLFPGDVLVIPPRSLDLARDVNPIVCLGLVDRPVVLGLTPQFANLGDLVAGLCQSPRLTAMTRVIDPHGTQTTSLTSGSVVIFNHHEIDKAPLQQPGAVIPPVIEIGADDRAGQVSSQAQFNPEILSAANLQPQTELPPAAPPMLVIAPPNPLRILTAEKPVLPELPSIEPTVVAQPSVEAEIPMPPPLPPISNQIVKTPREVPASSLDEFPQATTLEEELQRSVGDEKPEAAMPAPVKVAAAPLPPIEKKIEPPRLSTPEVEKNFDLLMPIPAPNGAVPASPLFFITLTLTLLLGGAGIAMSWPNLNRTKSEPQPAEQAVPASEFAASPAQNSQEIAAPIPQEAPASALQAILSREAPLIEERIIVPGQWPLHGKVVGHRRIILNNAHESVPGPHFVISEPNRPRKSQTPGATARERELRENLRDFVRRQKGDATDLGLEVSEAKAKTAGPEVPPPTETPPAPSVPPATVDLNLTPTPHAKAFQSHWSNTSAIDAVQQFDIVQPPHPAQKSASSPLERALRALATEKRG